MAIDNKQIERSIITTYRSKLWSKFTKGVKEYNLVEDGDKIAVCVSGGKDSLLMAKLLQEMQKHGKTKFDLEFIAMNPGFDEENTQLLLNTCKELEIDVKMFDTQIFEIASKVSPDHPCYLCAKMRRGALYDYAEKLGCNKIALGHHYNDFIETTMMNILYAGSFKTMRPKLNADNYEGMQLIRPLVYIKERDIVTYTLSNNIRAMGCGCTVATGEKVSKRRVVKELIEDLRKTNPDVEKSLFSAAKNVNLDSIIGYSKNKEYKFFLDSDY